MNVTPCPSTTDERDRFRIDVVPLGEHLALSPASKEQPDRPHVVLRQASVAVPCSGRGSAPPHPIRGVVLGAPIVKVPRIAAQRDIAVVVRLRRRIAVGHREGVSVCPDIVQAASVRDIPEDAVAIGGGSVPDPAIIRSADIHLRPKSGQHASMRVHRERNLLVKWTPGELPLPGVCVPSLSPPACVPVDVVKLSGPAGPDGDGSPCGT
jgi:hypothetical protein